MSDVEFIIEVFRKDRYLIFSEKGTYFMFERVGVLLLIITYLNQEEYWQVDVPTHIMWYTITLDFQKAIVCAA